MFWIFLNHAIKYFTLSNESITAKITEYHKTVYKKKNLVANQHYGPSSQAKQSNGCSTGVKKAAKRRDGARWAVFERAQGGRRAAREPRTKAGFPLAGAAPRTTAEPRAP